MNIFTFDIETTCNPDAESIFEPVFEPDSRLVDPEKIANSIKEKREKWLEDGALRAERGKALIVGAKFDAGPFLTYEPDQFIVYETDAERHLVQHFWEAIDIHVQRGHTIAGWNILGFDLPFMLRRAMILGVKVNKRLIDLNNKWYVFRFPVFDGMRAWQMGDKTYYTSLDVAMRAFGVGKKTGSGKNFAKLYAENRDKALEYLRNDVEGTHAVIQKMLA